MAEVEHLVKMLTIDQNIAEELKKLQDEGWRDLPGVPGVIVYHLVRQKSQPVTAGAGVGKLQIDDSKIMILRDGKLVQ